MEMNYLNKNVLFAVTAAFITALSFGKATKAQVGPVHPGQPTTTVSSSVQTVYPATLNLNLRGANQRIAFSGIGGNLGITQYSKSATVSGIDVDLNFEGKIKGNILISSYNQLDKDSFKRLNDPYFHTPQNRNHFNRVVWEGTTVSSKNRLVANRGSAIDVLTGTYGTNNGKNKLRLYPMVGFQITHDLNKQITVGARSQVITFGTAANAGVTTAFIRFNLGTRRKAQTVVNPPIAATAPAQQTKKFRQNFLGQ